MTKPAVPNVGDAALFAKLSLTALAGEEPMRAPVFCEKQTEQC